ncbi:MAG: NUDIX domain-containing protein [Fibrobacter sp.]|nr:NUDIX domain-containing protein [Fibrobacter sp.]
MLKYTNFKYCPKCGRTNLEILDRNGVFCPDCDFTYYHNTASAVGAIINTPEGIILIRRAVEPKKGFLDVPGGFVDYGENLEDALNREIKEELSIDVSNPVYLCSFPNIYTYKKITYFTTDSFFVYSYDGAQRPVLNNENSELIYVQKDSLPIDEMAFDSGKSALNLFFSKKQINCSKES